MLLQSHRMSNAGMAHSLGFIPPKRTLIDLSFRFSSAYLCRAFYVRFIEGSMKLDRAVRYPVPKRDIEETSREAESDVTEATRFVPLPYPAQTATTRR
jgi:hypothetical protein